MTKIEKEALLIEGRLLLESEDEARFRRRAFRKQGQAGLAERNQRMKRRHQFKMAGFLLVAAAGVLFALMWNSPELEVWMTGLINAV